MHNDPSISLVGDLYETIRDLESRPLADDLHRSLADLENEIRLRQVGGNIPVLLLLWFIMKRKKEVGQYAIEERQINCDQLKELIEERIDEIAWVPSQLPAFDSIVAIIRQAAIESHRLQHAYVGTEHVWLAAAKNEEPGLREVLGQIKLDYDGLRDAVVRVLGPQRR